MATEIDLSQSAVVRYPVEFDLPTGSDGDLANAAEAVKREYRNSVRWKRLRCRNVTLVSEQKDEAIYVLELGQSVEFDWTWEGAIAFRPLDVESFSGNSDSTDDFSAGGDEQQAGFGWSGEVVEVDEAKGRIWIWVSNPESPPTTGSFYVRPFEFLAFLYAIYCDPAFQDLRRPLPARLAASRGEVHPRLEGPPIGGLEHLNRLWKHSWGVLWGPPGTGKTFTVGQQVATCLSDPTERILVVSTTNKATDEVALSIGRAARTKGNAKPDSGRVLRIGKSAQYEMYDSQGLAGLLKGTETELLRQTGQLTKALHRAETHEDRAVIRKQIQSIRRQMKDASYNAFISKEVQVVVATAFKALTLINDATIRSSLEERRAPFTTIIIDEAGLISRATAAALSLLASRRVLLVGDSKQLAPISRISRILPTGQATWLASSGLSHLRSLEQVHDAVHLLREQHRMHPHVCSVVSGYQYENKLLNGSTVKNRIAAMPVLLKDQPRSLWYVLDEDGDDIPSIRAERGPGNRSWVRPKTRSVLKKLFSDGDLRNAKGLFISPFVAQARDIRHFFAEEGIESWSAATVHSQQGTEADFVIFDTVNAGSCGWPYDEWKRLVNVGLSRAREFVLVLASRAEMREPYLKSLTADLAPRTLKWSGRSHKWMEVPVTVEFDVPGPIAANPHLVGNQIAKRKELRPVLSFEQQRLCGLSMDGKPRLVRGVAGSGKTVVLAHWVLKTMKRLSNRPETKIWAVYANRSLQRLIADTIEEAWKTEGGGSSFPWHRVELCHIKDLLDYLLPEVGLRTHGFEFDYDRAAAAFLLRRDADEVQPRCHAMFIDEAQDMGPSTLKLLSSLVEKSDEDDRNSRSVNIFYDNAQNIYGRSAPKWSDLGLDMRGRSSVMKESFRSTRPIAEFALNVLYRLQPPDADADHKELVERGMVEKMSRSGRDWWQVRFNQVDGPRPSFRKFPDRDSEMVAMGRQVVKWISEEGVKPNDICILYNGPNIGKRIETQVAPLLQAIKCNLNRQTSQAFDEDARTVRVTTAHSYKGYDSEIVVIASVDKFVTKEAGVLANTLYVAMTRARSELAIYGIHRNSPQEADFLSVLEECLGQLVDQPKVEKEISRIDDFEEVVQDIGPSHRAWIETIWKGRRVEQEPIIAADGEILAEPVFWFKDDQRIFACFGPRVPGKHILDRMEDSGIQILQPGDPIPGAK